ncbi:MAG: hypothetical protein WBS24_07310 [Terriglobales bacterium]
MPITKYEGQTFTKKVFQLEECWFVNCVLRECVIFYSGGAYEVENATFDNCEWKFQNQARNTVFLLTNIGMLRAEEVPPQAILNSGPVH